MKPARSTSIRIATIVIAVCSSISTSARASDPAAAQALFEEALKLMDAGNYGAACPKFAESQKLDPAGGTLLNLGRCYEGAGKTASAWAVYQDAAVVAREEGRERRRRYALQRIEALEPLLPRVTFVLTSSADLAGLSIELDRHVLPRATWDTQLPLDPGDHHIQVKAPGHSPWSKTIKVAPSAKQSVTVPVLQPLGQTAPAPEPTRVDRTEPPETSGAISTSSPDDKTLAYVLGGAGVALLGVGAYFGVKAFSTWDDRDAHCPDGKCDPKAVELAQDANRMGHVSNVATGVGLIGVGVSGYLLLTDSPPAKDGMVVGAAAGRDGAAMTLRGAF